MRSILNIYSYFCKVKQKSEDKQKRIQDALIAIVNQSGLAGVKMSGVAKKAGIAQGTVYLYFKTKSELINATYLNLKSIANKEIITSTLKQKPYLEALQTLWKNYCSFLISHKRELYFMQQCSASDLLEEKSKKESALFISEITSFFERGKKEGLVKDHPIELILAVFSGIAKEIVPLCTQNQKNKNKCTQIIDDAFEMCWRAIRR